MDSWRYDSLQTSNLNMKSIFEIDLVQGMVMHYTLKEDGNN